MVVHAMSGYNEFSGTADCAECGRVKVYLESRGLAENLESAARLAKTPAGPATGGVPSTTLTLVLTG